MFVGGRGLNAELGGALHVGGAGEEPAISGGFDMRNGTISMAGPTPLLPAAVASTAPA